MVRAHRSFAGFFCCAVLAAAAQTVPDELAAANTAKAIAEARKAQAEADLAALKARLGTDVASPYGGSVSAGAGSGTIEAFVLAADATRGAARDIVNRVAGKGLGPVVLIAGAELPKFDSLISFRLGKVVFEEAYKDAKATSDRLEDQRAAREAERQGTPPRGVGIESVPPAAIALGLDSLNKILGFFKTDYTMGGMELTVDDTMILHAVAGELSDRAISTTLPIQYNRPAIDTAGSTVLKSFLSIARWRADAATRASVHEAIYNELKERFSKEPNDTRKKEYAELAKKHKEAWDKWTAVGKLFDGLFGKLGIADDKGSVPIALIIKEAAIEDALNATGARLLIVKSIKAGGSYYTKKNIWTSLGAMPFFAAGGVVTSFVLFDGPKGTVLAAGVVPIHGGYRRIDRIESNFRAPAQAVPRSNERSETTEGR